MIDMFNEFVAHPLWKSAIKSTTEDANTSEDAPNQTDSPESICARPDALPFTKGSGSLSKTNLASLPTSYLTYSPALSGLVIGCAVLGAACYMFCLRRGQSVASSQL
jgi:small neutral amino acid transporter SnatA (MarC family)